MEAFAIYLLKSIAWLTGFALIYLLFLRNERFFTLKRIYLIAGIIISVVFPFFTIHYQVELTTPITGAMEMIQPGASAAIPESTTARPFDYRLILLFFYLSGVLFLGLKVARHVGSLYRAINKAGTNERGPAKLVRASGYPASFSFFNYVFINPSIAENETEEILNHELVHVRQKHWFDLLIAEVLRIVQWVNPFVWIYTGFIRLNHEYLADASALRRTSNPANYRAALLNQLFSSPVISLSNSFNYSLNKRRFEMMKKIITSPYRKLKVLFILPVFAIVFYAFATPEYHYLSPAGNVLPENSSSVITAGEVRGVVLTEDNKPLEGVNIVVTGTNERAKTDASGKFTISNVPEEASLVISQAGYKTQFIKAEFDREITIKLMKDPDFNKQVQIRSTSTEGTASIPLYVVDGVIFEKGQNIPVADIANLNVIKGTRATDKYGEKGKNGVVEITTRKKAAEMGIKVPFRRSAPEDFPTFQGGSFTIFRNWVISRIKYPAEAQEKKLEGFVKVSFTVDGDGTVSDVKITRYVGSTSTILGEAVVQIVKSSPKWEPAKNPEARIPFQSSVNIRFRLPDKISFEEEPFVVVEEMPMYPGGDAALLKFIAENTQYPEEAKAQRIEGRVIARFFVNTEGNVEDISILKGVHPLLDAEAARVVSLLSGFKPGMQGGQAVSVWYMVPITFLLPAEEQPKQ